MKKKIIKTEQKIKSDISDKVVRGIAYVFVAFFALICVIPLFLVIGTSLSSEAAVRSQGFTLIPSEFSIEAYKLLFLNPKQILGSFGVTALMTILGTALGICIMAMTGYALQRKDFPFRNAISFYIYFTTLFSAGLAPYYLTMTQTYHLKDNYLAVFLPLLMSPWLIILMKNFIKSIPYEITESGKIDGAGDMTIFIRLILPMLKPALATVGLFTALGYWNEWYYSSLFLSSKIDYKPLQYHLYNVINRAAALQNSVAGSYVSVTDLPTETLKMATAVVATGPIIFLYPFVQKYFIGGITVGAVKG